jgi:hypothetical protein
MITHCLARLGKWIEKSLEWFQGTGNSIQSSIVYQMGAIMTANQTVLRKAVKPKMEKVRNRTRSVKLGLLRLRTNPAIATAKSPKTSDPDRN